ncbi:MAG: hypothetical protein P8125_11350 [Gemmatimonadota bacterium]|jgi:hypothetical protein
MIDTAQGVAAAIAGEVKVGGTIRTPLWSARIRVARILHFRGDA